MSFSLTERLDVGITLCDVRGRLVRVLVDRSLSTGIYFVRMTAGEYSVTKKAVLLK